MEKNDGSRCDPHGTRLLPVPKPGGGEAARRRALLDARLAGCINILPDMVSLYDWKGAREEASEAVLIAKTSAKMVARVVKFLAREHSYEVPAILTLPLADVNAPYRAWLLEGIG
jgi:periplasmic divalent cation tolerance protein